MAAFSHVRGESRTSIAGHGVELPSGSCNYRDLNVGPRAPTCGCKRFWLNTNYVNAQGGNIERAWCFCGHHACYHHTSRPERLTPEHALSTIGINGVAEHATVSTLPNDEAPHNPPKPPMGLGIQSASRSQPQAQAQSINTRVWQALNDFARNQEDGWMSEATSKLPSTNAPSLVEEPRLSANQIIEDRLQQYQSRAPNLDIPSEYYPEAEEWSATEVNTPSLTGTPDPQAGQSSSTRERTSPGHLQPGRINSPRAHTEPPAPVHRPTRPAVTPEARPTIVPNATMSLQDVQSILRAHGQRIEVLESLSFSHVPVEDIHERLELFDGRVLDLEQWRTDHERNHTSPEPARPSSSKRRRPLPNEATSFASDGSFDSSAAAHAETAVLATLAANAETHPKIDALESRVADLENAALPSFARPWEVQVVFLPWSRNLGGIWFSSTESTEHSLKTMTQNSEEWTGAQSGPKLSFKSATSGAWTTESIQAWANEAQEWLSPKACGPSGTVFQRLASRGLVRYVTLTSPDARHVLDAIDTAFSKIVLPEVEFETDDIPQYQGLSERFIPLRKVRKSARLRFLSPREMVTSATWNASFLDSSVFMKVTEGQRRLYVTTPEAYVQPSDPGMTWRDIRRLPSFGGSGEAPVERLQDSDVEACWAYCQQLDRPMSVHSSFDPNVDTKGLQSDIDNAKRQPSSSHSEARPRRQRTISLPSSGSPAEQGKEALPKRRVASFETGASTVIRANELDDQIGSKRRRISYSHEAERRGVNFTPRRSREPPSPFTSEAAADVRSQEVGRHKRGRTPSAYATPHSHNNVLYRMEYIGFDGDTEANTEIAAENSERGEEEWEGVDDGDTNYDHGDAVFQEAEKVGDA